MCKYNIVPGSNNAIKKIKQESGVCYKYKVKEDLTEETTIEASKGRAF